MAASNNKKKEQKINRGELPHNSDAERACLGSAMLDQHSLYTILSNLAEDDFFEARHQLIFRALVELEKTHKGVEVGADTYTVAQQLMNMAELENVGGPAYLQECCDSMVALSSLDFYIAIVTDNASLRRMLTCISDIQENYYSNSYNNINDFMLGSETSFKDIMEKRRVTDFKEASTIAKEVSLTINAAAKKNNGMNSDDVVTGITTGYRQINKYTQGFHEGQLIILAARPSVGKTALALNIAFHAATESNRPVAIFSLEMDAPSLITRLVASRSCVPMQKITTGDLIGEERQKVSDAIKEVGSAPIYIDDNSGTKLMEIIAKCRNLQAKTKDLGLVVIDYLGLIQTSTNARNPDSRQEEVRKISLALKGLARDLHVPVLALSQLSRGVEQRGDNKRPMLSDLRDSGSIEQDADIVMLLYRDDYYASYKDKVEKAGKKQVKDMSSSEKAQVAMSELQKEMGYGVSYVECNIAKNRNGQVGNAGLFFYKSYGRFDSPSEEWLQRLAEMNNEAYSSQDRK